MGSRNAPHDGRRNGGLRRNVAGRRTTAFLLVGALVLAAAACDSSTTPAETTSGSEPEQTSAPTDATAVSGRYVISTLDRDFDASHRITLDVPDGYGDHGGFALLKN